MGFNFKIRSIKLNYCFFIFKDPVETTKNIIADVNSTTSLSCNSTELGLNETIQWTRINNNLKFYLPENASNVQFINNGEQIIVNNLTLQDGGYYACHSSNLTLISEYFLVVKSKFVISLSLNTVNSNKLYPGDLIRGVNRLRRCCN